MKKLICLFLFVLGNLITFENVFSSLDFDFLLSSTFNLSEPCRRNLIKLREQEIEEKHQMEISNLKVRIQRLEGNYNYSISSLQRLCYYSDIVKKLQIYEDKPFDNCEYYIKECIRTEAGDNDFLFTLEMMLNKLIEFTSSPDFVPTLQDLLFKRAFSAAQKNIKIKNKFRQHRSLILYKNILQKLNPVKEHLPIIVTIVKDIDHFL